MVTIEYHDPSGALDASKPYAPRLTSLAGKRIGQFTLGGSTAAPTPAPGQPPIDMNRDADELLQVRVPVKAGLRNVSATMIKSSATAYEGVGPNAFPLWSREGDTPSVPAAITALLLTFAVLFGWFIRTERRSASPMLDLGLFRSRTFASASLAASLE